MFTPTVIFEVEKDLTNEEYGDGESEMFENWMHVRANGRIFKKAVTVMKLVTVMKSTQDMQNLITRKMGA
uniref:Uncharacterized protein n=1 Tax=Romanomermis culicivorax TaxID=13658 RepID=A0A915IXE7_ROMCU